MIKDQVDAYAARIAEVKEALTSAGWNQVRGDEWQTAKGSSLRFSYAHLEWRIHVKFVGRDSRWHSVRVYEVAPPPSVNWILGDMLDINSAQ